MIDKAKLRLGAEALGIALRDEQLERFELYSRRLYEANQRTNLTTVPPEEVVTRHFLDSLTVAVAWKPFASATVLDVGTGAGFPGLPLKIAYPFVTMTLLDSRQEPCLFLRSLCEELQLSDVELIHARAERAAHEPRWRERFDMVTARAVSHLWALAEWTLPFVRVAGAAVWIKRPTQLVEIEQAGEQLIRLGGEQAVVIEVSVPFSDVVNLLVCCRKAMPTHEVYPRATARVLREVKRFKA